MPPAGREPQRPPQPPPQPPDGGREASTRHSEDYRGPMSRWGAGPHDPRAAPREDGRGGQEARGPQDPLQRGGGHGSHFDDGGRGSDMRMPRDDGRFGQDPRSQFDSNLGPHLPSSSSTANPPRQPLPRAPAADPYMLPWEETQAPAPSQRLVGAPGRRVAQGPLPEEGPPIDFAATMHSAGDADEKPGETGRRSRGGQRHRHQPLEVHVPGDGGDWSGRPAPPPPQDRGSPLGAMARTNPAASRDRAPPTHGPAVTSLGSHGAAARRPPSAGRPPSAARRSTTSTSENYGNDCRSTPTGNERERERLGGVGFGPPQGSSGVGKAMRGSGTGTASGIGGGLLNAGQGTTRGGGAGAISGGGSGFGGDVRHVNTGPGVHHAVSAGTGGSEEWPGAQQALQARNTRAYQEPQNYEDEKACYNTQKRKVGRQPSGLGSVPPPAAQVRRSPDPDWPSGGAGPHHDDAWWSETGQEAPRELAPLRSFGGGPLPPGHPPPGGHGHGHSQNHGQNHNHSNSHSQGHSHGGQFGDNSRAPSRFTVGSPSPRDDDVAEHAPPLRQQNFGAGGGGRWNPGDWHGLGGGAGAPAASPGELGPPREALRGEVRGGSSQDGRHQDTRGAVGSVTRRNDFYHAH